MIRVSLVLIPGWVASLLGRMWRSTALWGIPLRQNLKDHQKSKAHVCHPLPLVPRTLPPGSPQVLSNSGLALTSHLYARDWEASLGNVGATVQAQPFTGHPTQARKMRGLRRNTPGFPMPLPLCSRSCVPTSCHLR